MKTSKLTTHPDSDSRNRDDALLERIWQRLGIADELRMFDEPERCDPRRRR